MAESLKDLIARYAQPGEVTWIGLRPVRRGAMLPVEEAVISERGLQGDHGASQKRAVTFLQAEHLPVIAAMLGRMRVEARDLRRNIVVSGINLAALKGRQLQVGTAVLEITTICAPCSRMEEAFGPGGYSAVRGHGGYCARIIQPGVVRLCDRVTPLTTSGETPL
ncbi:MAG: MOSC domain-containing protein [Pseudomonadota bacterium]